MSLVVGGRREETPFRSLCWLDCPDLRLTLPEDGTVRRGWGTEEGPEIRAVVVHSTKGLPTHKRPIEQRVIPGSGPPGAGLKVFAYWRKHGEDRAGAHVTVDPDGTICQGADLLSEAAFHAGDSGVNHVTIGVEVYQGDEGEFYQGQLDAWADFCLWLCQRFGLPLRAQFGYPRKGGRPLSDPHLLRGVYGHRDCSPNRGWGDPGDAVFLALRDRAGFFLGDLRDAPPPPTQTTPPASGPVSGGPLPIPPGGPFVASSS